ncbi:hypothetical protein Cni_G21262 [Canna indica]|uniref:RING-CH-type domain-containing protein n=1 Tax=Canna indica TaxID=4628 RepID=A0AAQ3QLI6_9LILI|nr:hypothetical protein Cni_G21262 [Canna indica]
MGDHLALVVDHLVTESTLQTRKQNHVVTSSASFGDLGSNNSTSETTAEDRTSPSKLVECRICQEEDQDANMEIPCSCCGSLKYAHRVCVQRWCNEKGNTMCEICLQQFKPGYTTPPKIFRRGNNLLNFRGSWGISRQELDDSQIIMVPPGIIEFDYDDYPSSQTRTTVCCRSVIAVFMVVLILRHTLPLLIAGADEYSFTLFSLLVLKTAGILVPVFFMVGMFTSFQRHRLQQATQEMADYSSEVEDM